VKIVVCMMHLSFWSWAIAEDLQNMGHEVHIFDIIGRPNNGLASQNTPGIQKEYEAFKTRVAGIHLYPSAFQGNLRYMLAAPRLRKLCRSVGADVVLTLYAGGFATMAFLSGFRPYAVYAVGSDVLMAGGYKKLMGRIALGGASQVFANGAYLAERTKDLSPEARVMPLLIGTDLSRIPEAEHRPGIVQMICTREFKPVYNNDAIIQAIARLPSDCPDFRMVFVSAGELLGQTIALADSLLSPELRSRVVFWRGVPFDKLLDGLKNSHVYISMSRSDGTATALLEAMGAGLFPVMSDIPQNRPWIDPEKQNGLLAPLDDIEALSATILQALRKGETLGTHAGYNRELIRKKADSAENRGILEKRLKEIVYEQ
jgi:L-malate glycosyltransferase